MTKFTIPREAVQAGALALIGVVIAELVCLLEPHALPADARRYEVPCEACHTIVPALNPTGLEFQANHFNWPGGPPRSRSEFAVIPVSAMAAYASADITWSPRSLYSSRAWKPSPA